MCWFTLVLFVYELMFLNTILECVWFTLVLFVYELMFLNNILECVGLH